ncbi:MAG: aminotransferase class V-fold PLP-dependent enzyme [Candidatus Eremiobacteraeota bacterium]|nr:aminotransferase class V-fold PLP-dependent enzyme [Candidatus Eremiobacteraeota bacterium]
MAVNEIALISRIRKLFPVAGKSLYLNHAAVSPYSTRVAKEMKNFIRARTFSDNVDLYPSLMEKVEAARLQIAQLIGAPPDLVALVKNTSEGLNILAESLPLKAGDRVLLFEREFPANIYPFLNLKRRGIEIDFAREKGNCFTIEEVERALTPRTRLLSVSHVEFLTGFRHDLAAMGRLLRERGIVFCVDAIQSAGAVPINVEKMHIDFISCGGQKWLMGPMGTGFIYMSAPLLEGLDPVFAGWLAVENSWDFFGYQLKWLPSARRYEGGTQNFIGALGLLRSVELLNSVGEELREKRILENTGRLISGLKERGIEVITPEELHRRAGIVTFRVEKPEHIFQELTKHKVYIALREGLLRVSPHFYNTLEEMDRFIESLDCCLASL